MVLLLMVFLGAIAWAILHELEQGREVVALRKGACPGCGREADADWLICPHCRTMLRERCDRCGQQRSVFHRYCPLCGTAVGERCP